MAPRSDGQPLLCVTGFLASPTPLPPKKTMTSAMLGKRIRDDPDAQWIIRFSDARALRCIVEANMEMTNVVFKIERKQGVYWLEVDSTDYSKTSVVSARLMLEDVEMCDGETRQSFQFCLGCEQLMIALEGGVSHSHIELHGLADSAKVRVVVFDPDDTNWSNSSLLCTKTDEDIDPTHVEDLQFKYVLRLDLHRAKDFLKRAKKTKAENVLLDIRMNDSASYANVRMEVQSSLQSLSVEWTHNTTRETNGSLVFTSRSVGDGGSSVPSNDNLSICVHEYFPIAKLDFFLGLKSLHVHDMDCHINEGMPIAMKWKLNGESDESRVTCVVACVSVCEDELLA